MGCIIVGRDEARFTYDNTNTKLTTALQERDHLTKEIWNVGISENSSEYEELESRILEYDELVKVLDEKIRRDQET